MLGLALVLWLFSTVAAAQQFAVPSSWMNTSSHFTRAERISLAQGAIDQIITQSFPAGTMTKALLPRVVQETYLSLLSIISAIARKDLLSGTQDNKAYVDGELGALIRNDTGVAPGKMSGISYLGPYAVACMAAYHAYGGEQYVEKASSLWTAIQANQVTEMNAAYGSHNSVNFHPECLGRSVVGAIPDHWINGSDMNTSPQDMMNFVRLSAYLVETDGANTTVTDSAYAALQFWHTVPLALSPVPGCSLSSIDLNPSPSAECTSTSASNNHGSVLYHDCSSYYAGGALALSAVTQNSTWYQTITDELGTFLLSSTIPSNGIINENVTYGDDEIDYVIDGDSTSNKFDMMFSLADIWNLSISQAPELSNLLQAFTNVQLNAMMANATKAGSNLYSLEWSGPPETTYSLGSMVGALGALIASIGPTPLQNQTASAPSSSASAASITHEHPSVPHGAVIGIAVAGATLVCLVLAYIIARAYRKRRQANLKFPDPLVSPFSSASMTSNDPSVLVVTGEKETTMLWRGQVPVLEGGDRREGSIPLSRALQRKEQRAQQRARVQAESGPVEAEAVAAPESGPSTLAPANVQPLDIQQLLRRAGSLSTAPGTPAADLRQRLAELGPIPEVLEALQDLLHNETAADPDLPQYEETRRRNV